LKKLGQKVIVSFNQYHFDTSDEIEFMRKWASDNNHKLAVNNSFAQGGDGAIELAEKVVEVIENDPSKGVDFTYSSDQSIKEKLDAIVQKVYGGKKAVLSATAALNIKRVERLGLSNLPVCIAKTQYSFTDDPKNPGLDGNFEIEIRELVINEGAGFIVAVAGQIMRMPGLPKEPQALHIDLVNGQIEGLS
jgi:formate--tetrahydrofolate ligase